MVKDLLAGVWNPSTPPKWKRFGFGSSFWGRVLQLCCYYNWIPETASFSKQEVCLTHRFGSLRLKCHDAGSGWGWGFAVGSWWLVEPTGTKRRLSEAKLSLFTSPRPWEPPEGTVTWVSRESATYYGATVSEKCHGLKWLSASEEDGSP